MEKKSPILHCSLYRSPLRALPRPSACYITASGCIPRTNSFKGGCPGNSVTKVPHPPALLLAFEGEAWPVTRSLTCQSAERHSQAQQTGAAPLTQFPIQWRGGACAGSLQGTQSCFWQVLRWNQI